MRKLKKRVERLEIQAGKTYEGGKEKGSLPDGFFKRFTLDEKRAIRDVLGTMIEDGSEDFSLRAALKKAGVPENGRLDDVQAQ